MQRDQFVAEQSEPWWLLKPDLENGDEDLHQKRRALGECWGWSEDWYTAQPSRPAKLQELYRFLEELHGNLLLTLDDATEIANRRTWLAAVIKAKQDSLITVKPPAVGEVGHKAKEVTTKAGEPTAAPAKRVSPFASAKRAEEQSVDTAATSTIGPRKPSALSMKGASAEPGDPAPVGEPEMGAPSEPPPAEARSVEEVRESLSELAANTPMSQNDVEKLLQDPDFGKRLADAESAVEAELEAQMAAAESVEP